MIMFIYVVVSNYVDRCINNVFQSDIGISILLFLCFAVLIYMLYCFLYCLFYFVECFAFNSFRDEKHES